MFLNLVLSILYFLCETSTWRLDLCTLGDTWYGVILWVLEFNVRALKRSERVTFSRASLSVTPHWRGLIMAKQLSTATTPLLGSFGIVLMSCKVNFNLLRSDLQNSRCIFFVHFFCYHCTVTPWNLPDATFYGWRKFKTFVFQRPLAFKIRQSATAVLVQALRNN